MRKLELGQTDVLGYSWGGLLAQQLAAQYPGAVRKLVLACTGPGMTGIPASPRVIARLMTPRRYYSPEYLAAIAPDTFGGKFRHDPSLVEAEVGRRGSHPPSWTGYAFQVAAASTFAALPFVAPLISQPTLILGGGDDPVFKTHNQHLLHRALRNSELRILEGAGHLLLLDTPEISAPIITSFLDRDRSLTRHAGNSRNRK
jgi:pimeloyl-ACP methyl ester carboxylesterase